MRKDYLDYLRIVAIVAVIVLHVSAEHYDLFGKTDRFGWWLANILDSATRFCVPIFVMISGAVLLGREWPVIAFYQKRSIRLLPPLVFWNALYLVLMPSPEVAPHSLFWKMARILTVGNTAGHLWYLSMFVCLMVFAPFINQFVNGRKPKPGELSILLAAALGFLALNELSEVITLTSLAPFYWFRLFVWFIPYFVMGFYIDQHGDRLGLKSAYAMAALAGIVLAGAGLNYYFAAYQGIVKDYLIMNNEGPLVFLMAGLVFFLARKHAGALKGTPWVRRFSDASFGVYLVHPLLMNFFKGQVRWLDGYSPTAQIPALIALTTAASFGLVLLIRKNRVMRALC